MTYIFIREQGPVNWLESATYLPKTSHVFPSASEKEGRMLDLNYHSIPANKGFAIPYSCCNQQQQQHLHETTVR
jgi:hypothetical protein